MDGLKKIELDASSPEPKTQSTQISMGTKRKRFFVSKRLLLIVAIVIFILTAISFFTVFLPAQKTYVSAKKTYQQAQSAWYAVKQQNVALAGTEIEKTKQDLKETQENLHSFGFMRFIPVAGGYYSDADHLVNAGFHGLDAATILIDAVKPYADVLGLKGQGSFAMGSAEQRIQTGVLTMGKITPKIDDIATSLTMAQQEIDKVDPNHYPSFIAGGKIKIQLEHIQGLVDQGIIFVDQARPLIKVLPSLLGESQEKKYLVLFQNDKEIRPTGVFITAYAIFRIEKGIIHVDSSSDIYSLDASLTKAFSAPDPILKYLPKVSTFNIRDSNLSPDFIESMNTFNSMYKYTSGQVDVDGIIALDTNVLVSTIKILDDGVDAGGLHFTSQEDKRCNCPQVIYELEDNISRPVNYVKTGRKDLLGSLLYAILGKAMKSSPKLYWGPLFQAMITQADQKHILIYLYNKEAQSGIEALNAAGRIQPFDGDYLHINEANFGGAKSNLFVAEAVDEEYSVASDGNISKTITIHYKNPHPPSDCDLERGALCINALLRDWIRIYVPKGSKMVQNLGSEVKMSSYEELGKTVFEGFLTVKPLGVATLTVKYTLPFKIDTKTALPLLIQKQPGTNNNAYTIKVNGREVEKFELLTDKKVSLKF